MNRTRKERLWIRSIVGDRQSVAKRHASVLLAASLMSVGALAACSSDNGSGNTDGGETGDSGITGGDTGTTGGDSGTPGSDSSTGGGDSSTGGDAGPPGVDSGPTGSDSGTDSGKPGDSGADAGGLAAVVRATLDGQTPGGIGKLKVPTTIPVAPNPAAYPGRYDITPAKVYLGKLLYHDPIRTQRVDLNKGQPLDFPKATAFGGTIGVTDSPDGPLPTGLPTTLYGTATTAQVQAVVNETIGTGSCGSCHIGEAAGKAGQQLNFNTGGEGRGYTDASGNFIPRRRPMASLIKFRSAPLFPGDIGVDALPTLTDIFQVSAGAPETITTPALFYHNLPTPAGFNILQSGRLDQLDSVGRESPSMVGFAFNNRLLFGGFGGEPSASPGSLQPSAILLNPPVDDPAQENLNFLLLDAHRMLGAQDAVLQANKVFVKLFEDAYPALAAQYQADAGSIGNLINAFTESQARAAFLRTQVASNTPYDKFLAGDDTALTAAQLRGAQLFFTPATSGGAGCVSCHSGPMLNKQPSDSDLAGVGALVEENFINVGIGDHPVQALNAYAKGHATAYHAEDTGRAEITGNASHRYKFRSLTLRQLKTVGTFFHNGSFTSIRDVVQYFNAGVPQDATAGAEPTLDARFTSPRGAGTTGLGLTPAQVDDLTDFITNGLYDPGFAASFQPTADDLNYSKNRPDLAALGAVDGVMPSGSAIDDNDPLARRDEGLEFLDVTSQATTAHSTSGNVDTWVITNSSASVIDTHLLVVLTNLASGVTVDATEKTGAPALPGGVTSGEPANEPVYRLYLPGGVLNPGQSVQVSVTRTGGGSASSYGVKLLSGQGKP